ncbi:MAG TPA: hypothetical protein VHE14_02445, partial [Solirubrobacteraceae bacterium]|nr:hypothetical protein [Solirubrobacteraceae bacterium]
MRRVASPAWPNAALLAAAYLILAPRSADLAAAVYRTQLFSDHPWALWNGAWYGGHHVLGYSLFFPPLAALLGPRVVGALSSIAAVVLFERIARREFGRARLGSLLFAVAAAANLFAQRLPFALGIALALGAVAAAQASKRWLALTLAAVTTLASPVAGVFLALAATGWGLATVGRRRFAAQLALAALAPVGILAVAFPEGGSQPFPFSSFWPIIAVCAVALVLFERKHRALRWATVLYGLMAVGAYAVASPMGGNAVRLGALFGPPLLAAALWPRRRAALVLALVPLLYWQWTPVVRDLRAAAGDRSTHASYYAPLLSFLRTAARADGPFRIEIPFTRNHWEAAYVARHNPIARGWERQLDVRYNHLFYRPRLTAARYGSWLRTNGIAYVALPDSKLDFSAVAEARLLRAGIAGLRPAWSSPHWRVWKVVASRPLASPSPLTTLGRE